MATYNPFFIIRTNVDIKKLKHTILVYNTRTNQYYYNKSTGAKPNQKYDFYRPQGHTFYRSQQVRVDLAEIEDVRDCVIICSVYRLSDSGQEKVVVDEYILSNKLEDFESSKVATVKNNEVIYKETREKTKTVTTQSSNQNTVGLIAPSSRKFICVEHPPGDPKDPFTKRQIEAGLMARLNEPLPDQGYSSLCGCAVFYYCLIHSKPALYKSAVKQLWEKGEAQIGNLKIKPSENGCRKVEKFYTNGMPKIPPIDWITLASLRESTNSAMKYKSPDNEVAGINLPAEVQHWLLAVGFELIYPTLIIRPMGISLEKLIEINGYVNDKYHVILLISTHLLNNAYPSLKYPEHWIILTKKITQANSTVISNGSSNSTQVTFQAYTYGEISYQYNVETRKGYFKANLSLQDILKSIFLAMVVKK